MFNPIAPTRPVYFENRCRRDLVLVLRGVYPTATEYFGRLPRFADTLPMPDAMSRMLRCYAHGRGNAWQAICVDLDTAVHAASLEEVKSALPVSVELYLSAVADAPAEDQHQLLNRSCPWYVRAKLDCLAWLPRSTRGTTRPEGFLLSSGRPVPAA